MTQILKAYLLISLLCPTPVTLQANEPFNEKLILQLKWFHQFQFAGYYAAQEKGFYEEEGLDVEIRERDTTTSSTDEVLTGNAQFGIADSSLALRRLKGQPLVALAAIFQHSPLVLMTLDKDNLRTPQDLIGKRVMYQRDLDDALIMAMMKEQGIKETDFHYIPHNFDNDALLKGHVDAMSAYISSQPYFYRQRGHEVSIINPANYGIDFYGDILFTQQQFLEQHPETALAFRRASIKGWHYALENSEEVITWLSDKYPSKNPYNIDNLRYEVQATTRMIQPHLIDIGTLNPSRFERIATLYKERGLASMSANLEGFFYQDYFKKTDNLKAWFFTVAIISILIAIGLIIVSLINKRLRQAVLENTEMLNKATKKLEHYIHIVDTHTMTTQVDKHFNFTYVSDAFCNISGYSREELIGQPHTKIIHPDFDEDALTHLLSCLNSGKPWFGEVKQITKHGLNYFVQANIDPDLDEEGNFNGYTSVRVDITDKKKIEHLAVTDPLTQLYNRIKIDRIIGQESKRCARKNSSFSLILFDIDYFKSINDQHGHPVGDQVLITFSELIKSRIRETDLAGRWGGEEFLVVCPDTNIDGALKLAKQLRETIAEHSFNKAGNITASFGVSEFRKLDTEKTILERADKALYQAKDSGRNCIKIASN